MDHLFRSKLANGSHLLKYSHCSLLCLQKSHLRVVCIVSVFRSVEIPVTRYWDTFVTEQRAQNHRTSKLSNIFATNHLPTSKTFRTLSISWKNPLHLLFRLRKSVQAPLTKIPESQNFQALVHFTMNNFLTSKPFRPFPTFYINPHYFPSPPEPIYHQPTPYTLHNIDPKQHTTKTIHQTFNKQATNTNNMCTEFHCTCVDCGATYTVTDLCPTYKITQMLHYSHRQCNEGFSEVSIRVDRYDTGHACM